MPYLTPEAIPTTHYCRRLKIPNDERIIGAVNGALFELGIEANWELDGAVTPDEIAEAMRLMFAAYTKDDFCMIGFMFPYPSLVFPSYCIRCNGSTHLRADYPELYDIIDPSFRISSTQFKVPETRHRMIIGNSSVVPDFSIGGSQTHVLTVGEMPTHDHPESRVQAAAILSGTTPGFGVQAIAGVTGLSGGNTAHNNMPPYITIPWLIIAR